jgi:hypothetical protein
MTNATGGRAPTGEAAAVFQYRSKFSVAVATDEPVDHAADQGDTIAGASVAVAITRSITVAGTISTAAVVDRSAAVVTAAAGVVSAATVAAAAAVAGSGNTTTRGKAGCGASAASGASHRTASTTRGMCDRRVSAATVATTWMTGS